MIISKNTKIFLILFSIILLIITILAIVYTNSHKGSDESQVIIENVSKVPIIAGDIEKTSDVVSGVSLDDTYSTNGLTYTYKEDEENDIFIRYPIISGLRDKSVQDSINSQILERIKKILDSNNFKNNSDDSAYADASVVGNFSDVLSVKIFVRFNNEFSKNYGVNFRLDNGEKIKINEFFIDNAPTKNIITSSAYKTFAISYYTNEGLSNQFYSNIESDILKFLIDYNNGKVAEFSFTPMYVELYRDGKTVRIEMSQYAKYIAIYDRFKSSSNLYEDSERVVSKLPVFTMRPNCIADLYEKVDDTCILDVYIVKSDSEKEEFSEKEMKAIDNYRRDLISRLDYVKIEAPIYYSNYVTVYRDKENGEDILVFAEREAYIKTSENEFTSRVYNKILELERDINNEEYVGSKVCLLNDRNLKVGEFEIKYSVETGYEIRNEGDEEPQETEEQTEEPHDEEISQESPIVVTPSVTEIPEVTPSPTPIITTTPTITPTPTSTVIPDNNITTQVYF